MSAYSLKYSLPLSLASGLLLVLVFPKFNLHLLSAVALVPLLIAVAAEPRGTWRFLFGVVAGGAFFGGTCYWIYGVMRNYGGLGIAASAAVFALFVLTLSLYWGLFSYLAGYLRKTYWGALAVPFLWVSLEYARSHLLSGFPWLLAGYALADTFGMARLSRWTGVYGLSFLVLMWNVAGVWYIVRRSKWAGLHLATVIAIAVLLIATAQPESYTENKKAYLVQTNIPEAVAFEPWSPAKQAPLLSRLQALTVGKVGRQETPSLIVWPETPAPFYFDDSSFVRPYAEEIARQTNSYFLLGIVGYVPSLNDGPDHNKPLNSEALLDSSGSILSQYDKIHLVPFGEYVPLKPWLSFADKLTAEVSDFVPGSRYVVMPLPGGRMAGFICYEAIFPDLVRRFVKDGAQVLVNTSNDGWYGSSAARYQHLLMARMRAVENARYLLRATNTGITAVIRPDGSIASQLPVDQPGVLVGQWAFLQQQTFYTRHGDVFAIASCVISAFALIAASRKRQR